MFKIYTGELESPRLIRHFGAEKGYSLPWEESSIPRLTSGVFPMFCVSGPLQQGRWKCPWELPALLPQQVGPFLRITTGHRSNWTIPTLSPFLKFPLKQQHFSFLLILLIILVKERRNHTYVKQDKNFGKSFLKKLSFFELNLTQRRKKWKYSE